MEGTIWLLVPLVFVVIFAGFGVYLAKTKGRSEGEGLFFGLLLGPLGLLLIVLLPTAEDRSIEDQADEDDGYGPRRYAVRR
jgi:hypothetical protein